MGTVKTTWLLPGHSGRPCSHEDIYTKQNRKTNKVYSVKLCNPNTDWNEKQLESRSRFGIINSAISAWLTENREKNTADYKKLLAQYDRQTKYSTIRGMMYGKGYATIGADGSVTIKIGDSASTVTGGGGSAPSGGGGSSSNDDVSM